MSMKVKHFQDSEYGWDAIWIDHEEIQLGTEVIYRKIKPSNFGQYLFISTDRKLSLSDLDSDKMDFMPGFEIKWHYSGLENIVPEHRFYDMSLDKSVYYDEESWILRKRLGYFIRYLILVQILNQNIILYC